MKQKTGIVNNKNLKTDFEKRDDEIKYFEDKINGMKEYH